MSSSERTASFRGFGEDLAFAASVLAVMSFPYGPVMAMVSCCFLGGLTELPRDGSAFRTASGLATAMLCSRLLSGILLDAALGTNPGRLMSNPFAWSLVANLLSVSAFVGALALLAAATPTVDQAGPGSGNPPRG